MSDQYRKASITADVILLDRQSREICLIQRKRPPFADQFAIIGGFFNPHDSPEGPADATIEDAAWRELKEETGVEAFADYVHARGFSHFRDAVGRDPRDRVVTFVYFLIVNHKIEIEAKDDAKSFRWFRVFDLFNKLVPLAFDHQQAIEKFLIKPH